MSCKNLITLFYPIGRLVDKIVRLKSLKSNIHKTVQTVFVEYFSV